MYCIVWYGMVCMHIYIYTCVVMISESCLWIFEYYIRPILYNHIVIANILLLLVTMGPGAEVLSFLPVWMGTKPWIQWSTWCGMDSPLGIWRPSDWIFGPCFLRRADRPASAGGKVPDRMIGELRSWDHLELFSHIFPISLRVHTFDPVHRDVSWRSR